MTTITRAVARIGVFLTLVVSAWFLIKISADWGGAPFSQMQIIATLDLLLLGSAAYFFTTVSLYRRSVSGFAAGQSMAMLTGFYLLLLVPISADFLISLRDWSGVGLFLTGAGLAMGLTLKQPPPAKTRYLVASLLTGLGSGALLSWLLLSLGTPSIPLAVGLLFYVYAAYRAWLSKLLIQTTLVAFVCFLAIFICSALSGYLFPDRSQSWVPFAFTWLLLMLPYAALSDYFFREQIARGGLASTLDAGLKDQLTGLANRRSLDLLGTKLYKRCQTEEKPCSVLMIDIDHFKQINDLYGHAAGDEVLKQFASIITGQVRATDLVIRYGGEEFTVILPGAPLSPAIRLAERIRISVEAAAFEFNGHAYKITTSIGAAAMYPGDSIELKALMERADNNLYRAKRDGRNQVMSDALITDTVVDE